MREKGLDLEMLLRAQTGYLQKEYNRDQKRPAFPTLSVIPVLFLYLVDSI